MEILRVESLKKYFESRKIFKNAKNIVRAVDGIDFSIKKNSVLAIVGESGCGKSTVARIVLGLTQPTSGKVLYKGQNLFSLNKEQLKHFRKSVQIIFQDPFASLNPRRTVYDTISEPLIIHNLVPRKHLKDAVIEIISKVGIDTDALNRYPHEFSGGQRQRICIARALAVSPELIVADEPLSALDVSIQAQILNLLQDLREKSEISFLFISHDLRVVKYFSDYVGVMYLGRIVEYADSRQLFERQFHPYTELLLSSAPRIREHKDTTTGKCLNKTDRHIYIQDYGDVPSPINIPPGCPFHPRCPKRMDICDKDIPVLREFQGRSIACHLYR